jgi:hypothetical protein
MLIEHVFTDADIHYHTKTGVHARFWLQPNLILSIYAGINTYLFDFSICELTYHSCP